MPAWIAPPCVASCLPTLPRGGQMIATDVVGVFLVPMKVALMVAFLIALPYVVARTGNLDANGILEVTLKVRNAA